MRHHSTNSPRGRGHGRQRHGDKHSQHNVGAQSSVREAINSDPLLARLADIQKAIESDTEAITTAIRTTAISGAFETNPTPLPSPDWSTPPNAIQLPFRPNRFDRCGCHLDTGGGKDDNGLVDWFSGPRLQQLMLAPAEETDAPGSFATSSGIRITSNESSEQIAISIPSRFAVREDEQPFNTRDESYRDNVSDESVRQTFAFQRNETRPLNSIDDAASRFNTRRFLEESWLNRPEALPAKCGTNEHRDSIGVRPSRPLAELGNPLRWNDGESFWQTPARGGCEKDPKFTPPLFDFPNQIGIRPNPIPKSISDAFRELHPEQIRDILSQLAPEPNVRECCHPSTFGGSCAVKPRQSIHLPPSTHVNPLLPRAKAPPDSGSSKSPEHHQPAPRRPHTKKPRAPKKARPHHSGSSTSQSPVGNAKPAEQERDRLFATLKAIVDTLLEIKASLAIRPQPFPPTGPRGPAFAATSTSAAANRVAAVGA